MTITPKVSSTFTFYSTRQVFHSASLSRFIGPAHNENPWWQDWLSDLAKAKLNSSNDYCSKSFFFLLCCSHKRKDLQVQEEHFSIMLLKGELCSLLSQYFLQYSCSLQSLSQMEGWRSTAHRSNPNICLATTEAFSLRQNTGLLCALPLKMISLFDWE